MWKSKPKKKATLPKGCSYTTTGSTIFTSDQSHKIAILGDERADWRPSQFGYQLFGCSVDFQFPVIKLLDYQQRQSELEASRNPFATVVMAHLVAVQTRNNRSRRLEQKLALVRRLYSQGFERSDVLNLLAFIDWMLTLPLDLETEFKREVEQLEAEQRMQYVTSFERSGIRLGVLEGIGARSGNKIW